MTGRVLRAIFIGICALIHFVYLVVAPITAFDILFGNIKIPLQKAAAFFDSILPTASAAAPQLAASDSLYMLPLYFMVVIIGFITLMVFINALIAMPGIIARFYIDRLWEFLFIDVRQTIMFFLMLLVPFVYLGVMAVIGQADIRLEIMEAKILSTISNTGVLMAVFTLRTLRMKSEPGTGFLERMEFLFLKPINILVTIIFFVGPYLAYYKIETDRLWVLVFHIFLIYSVINNFRFYRRHIDALLVEADED